MSEQSHHSKPVRLPDEFWYWLKKEAAERRTTMGRLIVEKFAPESGVHPRKRRSTWNLQ